MLEISADQFENAVAANPAWATTLTEPVKIVGYCHLYLSPITHLSPLLHFTKEDGENENMEVAKFQLCRHLKAAEGTFHGHVSFDGSNIEKIRKLTVTRPDNHGYAASFVACMHLKVAEGTFPGEVDFSDSAIERIGDLTVTAPGVSGHCADFTNCCRLKIAQGTYHGSVTFNGSGIEKIGNLRILRPNCHGIAASFARCFSLTIAEGIFPGSVDFSQSGIERIGELNITLIETDSSNEAANFTNCSKLRIATGSYPGYVDFSESGILRVRELTATRAKFYKCLKLEGVPHGFLDNPNNCLDPDLVGKLREIEQARQALKTGEQIEL